MFKNMSSWASLNRNKYSKVKLIARLFFLAFFGTILSSFILIAVLAYYAKDLPSPNRIVRKEGFATRIYDRNGELLYDVFTDQRRTPVKIDEVPIYVRQATISVEDKNFYKHGGFDPTGIARAIYNIVVNHRLQGGSTLTQQLVKNVLLTSQRTLPRKIKEFILAVQIESRYSKDEILQMYLNEAPYGGTACGIEAAAETYFNKKVTELNLVESAILAGLPQQPSNYAPYSSNPKAYIERTKQVLRRMKEDGYITVNQEKEAAEQLADIKFAPQGGILKAPHFVMYIKRQLENIYGSRMVEQGGMEVFTSLDLNLQETVQNIIAEEIAKVESKYHITNGAAVVLNPENGEILAMVGSKDYNDPNYDGEVNVALSLRQPGSAIKPITYVTALKKGYPLSYMLSDTATSFPIGYGMADYKPVNYDGKWHGPMQLRYALGNSMNMPAVKLLAIVGIKDMLQTAYDMGITTLEPNSDNLKRFGLAVTLGGGEVRLLELANAYNAFANSGYKTDPVSILKITDQKGQIIMEYQKQINKRIIKPEEAFLISNTLADNSARSITFGERNALIIPNKEVAVKTGTTNDRRDNWTVGWTPLIMVGVWVGNNDNSAMKALVSGVSGAAPIWRRIIVDALEGKANSGFPVPEGIVSAEVDAVSGFRAHDGFPSRIEYFVKGTEPVGDDAVHKKLKVCRGQDKLATSAQISRGEFEEKEYYVIRENDIVSTDGINRWQQGIDEWLATQPDWRYHPPQDYCGSTEEIDIKFEPGNETQVDSLNGEIKVIGRVIAINDVERTDIYINDNLKETVMNSRKFEKVFVLENGVYSIKVVAKDVKGNQAERVNKIGVNLLWNWQPSPTPLPTPTPTPTSSPTPTFSPTPTPLFVLSPTP